MISPARIIDRIIPVHHGAFEKEILFPLIRDQRRCVHAGGGYSRSDAETEIPGAGIVILENIASEIHAGGIKPLFVINDLAFEVPFIGRLITGNGDKLGKIRAKRVGKRLIVMRIVGHRIVMLIGVRPDDIRFKLEIQVLYIENIDVFKSQLQALLVGPITVRIMQDLVQNEFVDQQLPVELCGMADIRLEIESDRRLVRASVLLLGGDQEDHRVQIRKIIMIGPAEHHVLIKPEIEPATHVHAQVMDDGILFRILIVPENMLVGKLHKDILIIQLPDAHIELQEQVGSAVIAQEQTAVTIPDKILIIAELKVEILPGVKLDRGHVIEIIDARLFEILIISGARGPHGMPATLSMTKPGPLS